MKTTKVIIKKHCFYTPPGPGGRKVEVFPSARQIVVDPEQAERMVDGNVAEYVDPPKPKPAKKSAKDTDVR